MSGSSNAPRAYVATIVRGADGRFAEVDILPEPDIGTDQVLTWDAETQSLRWQSPEDLGFSAVPMILDVPIVDGSGAPVVEGPGNPITCNVPYLKT